MPNSTADNTRKKNVKDNKLMLSYKKPTAKVIMYSVIQSNSAVNKRCKAFETLVTMLKSNKKNKKK